MHSNDNQPTTDARGLRMAIVTSQYHAEVTQAMETAAVQAFLDAGGRRDDLDLLAVPGTFELTAVCRALAMPANDALPPDAIIALGCVITGETTHDQYIAQSVTHGLTQIIVQSGVPIAFGVLTCQTMAQARARAADRSVKPGAAPAEGNKGAEAMAAAIVTARTIARLTRHEVAP